MKTILIDKCLVMGMAFAGLCGFLCFPAGAETIKYGDFNSWITRNIKESAAIGGKTKTLYEIGPTATISGNQAYSPRGGSPWATSNVYAKVAGISKGSNAVYPAVRSGSNKCVKMTSEMQNVKVLGIVNMDVMVAGSIFLGQMLEPVKNTKNPYSKMIQGIPFTGRPKALVFDYKVDMPATNTRVKSSGMGKKKTLQGRDNAVAYVMLQRRWEEPDGSVHAKRVASGSKRFGASSPWVNGYRMPLVYGDPAGKSFDSSLLKLRSGANAYYTRNSKGKMVPIIEEGFDDADATPTHAIVMLSAGAGEPYTGTPGLTFYVDNVGWSY